jgi:hypothetical protein
MRRKSFAQNLIFWNVALDSDSKIWVNCEVLLILGHHGLLETIMKSPPCIRCKFITMEVECVTVWTMNNNRNEAVATIILTSSKQALYWVNSKKCPTYVKYSPCTNLAKIKSNALRSYNIHTSLKILNLDYWICLSDVMEPCYISSPEVILLGAF